MGAKETESDRERLNWKDCGIRGRIGKTFSRNDVASWASEALNRDIVKTFENI